MPSGLISLRKEVEEQRLFYYLSLMEKENMCEGFQKEACMICARS